MKPGAQSVLMRADYADFRSTIAAVQAHGAGPALYCLLDTALLPGALAELHQIEPELSWTSLFEGTPEAPMVEVAPLLISAPAEAARADRLLGFIYDTYELRVPCASWIVSARPREDLAARLRERLDATLPDGREVLVRFYDPRVLGGYLAALHDNDRRQLLDPDRGIRQWWWWDAALGRRSSRLDNS